MNNTIIAALLIAISILGAGFLYSGTDTIVSSGQAPFGTIQVSGEGKSQGIPDTTILNLGAQITQAETQESAYNEMNTTINAIQSILEDAGIEKENIQTANLSVNQNYSYIDGERVSKGFNAYQTLTIQIENKEESVTNNILDSVSKLENIRVDGVNFDLSDRNSILSKARIQALDNARMKAEEIAAATGVKIKKVLSVTEGTNNSTPIPMYRNSMDVMSDESIGANIQAGELDYTTNVNVTYEIQ